MGKHRGNAAAEDPNSPENSVLRDQNFTVPDADRVERDVNIVVDGWNNTPEEKR